MQAGIQVKMITGDHGKTAQAIGKTNWLEAHESRVGRVEIDLLSEEELQQAVKDRHLFERP